MKILYITRKYPPSIGGMQKMNFHLINELSRRVRVDKVTWGYSQIFLPIFILNALFYAIFCRFILGRRYDLIFIGDAMLAPLGLFLNRLTASPIICVVHGLDVTFKPFLYQKIIISSLKKLYILICVSENTKRECIARGIKESTIRVIPNGVDLNTVIHDKAALFGKLKDRGISVKESSKILLSVGRLVKRKGVSDFIENVFINLIKEYQDLIYIVIGSGRERSNIEAIIERHHLNNSVFLLGEVDEDILKAAYIGSDVFIMPNKRVEDDVEGFGIVALEASACATPVIAPKLEGITEAVKEAANGFLVAPSDHVAFKEKILWLLNNDNIRVKAGESAREFAKGFSWEKIGQRYMQVMRESIAKPSGRILMVSRAIEPPWDEASKNMVRDITKRLDKYQFHILTTDNIRGCEGNIVYERIYRNKKNTLSQKIRLFLYILNNRGNFDIYHFCFTPEPITSFLAGRLIDKDRKIWSIPYISSAMSGRRIRALAKNSRVIIAASSFTKDILLKQNCDNVELIYPGVDLTKFKPADEKINSRDNSLAKRLYTILYPGDLTTDTAVSAVEGIIKEVACRQTETTFIITSRVKESADERRIESLRKSLMDAGLNNRVEFLARVDNMALLMSRCGIVIYPYFSRFKKKIDIPYVIIEAMASSKPMIISDRRPLNEVIKDGAGIAVKTETPADFAEAVVYLLKDDLRAIEIGRRNRDVAQRYFDINKSMESLSSIYNRMLNK